MAILDWQGGRYDDGILQVDMTPPAAVGGWTVQWDLLKRQGGPAPLSTKLMASGFYGVSGINILDSGKGIFAIAVTQRDVSGLDPGVYYYQARRTDSGQGTLIAEGRMLLR